MNKPAIGKKPVDYEDSMKLDVGCCARCVEDHKSLTFKRFKVQCGEDTHWGICPNTLEPILMRVVRKHVTEK